MDEKWREQFVRVMNDAPKWMRETFALLPSDITHPNAVFKEAFVNRPNITRNIMGERISEAMRIIYNQNMVITNLENQTQLLKTELIKRQEDIISAKNEQLVELKEAVKLSVLSVEDAVKTELKTYSDAVQESGSKGGANLIDQNTLKSVVKDVVAEEDRSRNIIVFGLPEEPTEQINEKVCEVLQELGEKPRFEAARIGLKMKQDNPRPVRISLCNAITAQQILSRAKNLRKSDRFKLVYISPDRNIEQRAQHRKLLDKLKAIRTAEPNKRHFIRGGQIMTTDK